jgi:hypothetical protein
MKLKTLFKRESASIPRKNQVTVTVLIVAHTLFRFQDPKLASRKAGSKVIVGLKMTFVKHIFERIFRMKISEGTPVWRTYVVRTVPVHLAKLEVIES